MDWQLKGIDIPFLGTNNQVGPVLRPTTQRCPDLTC